MKVRVLHLIYGLAGATALVVGVWLWRAHEQRQAEQALDQGLTELRHDARDREHDRTIFTRPIDRYAANHEETARELAFAPPDGRDPGELDAVESVDAFAGVMDELEQALEDERTFDAEESAEYYNRANGSFKAMSAWIDGSDPRERAVLEDAHTRMLDLMRRLDIRPPARELDAFVSARDR
jgi:hypothetical protein